jgi:hypothetical protein
MQDVEKMEDEDGEIDFEVEAALNRQDEALALLERLRLAEPRTAAQGGGAVPSGGGGRREGRRWPPPEGVALEMHDGVHWQVINCLDLGIGGARVRNLPAWADGPTPARLKAAHLGSALALADIMWHDSHAEISGVRFEFVDTEDRETWAGLLVDSLLAAYAV